MCEEFLCCASLWVFADLPWHRAALSVLLCPRGPSVPPICYSPLRGLAVGTAGPALAQRRSIATTVGRRTRSRCSQGVPAWSPGEENAHHHGNVLAHTELETQTLCADRQHPPTPCTHSAPGEMPPCLGQDPRVTTHATCTGKGAR